MIVGCLSASWSYVGYTVCLVALCIAHIDTDLTQKDSVKITAEYKKRFYYSKDKRLPRGLDHKIWKLLR